MYDVSPRGGGAVETHFTTRWGRRLHTDRRR